ncbi:hypothetical protein VTK73DRAFT_473 [Phialemonium thermophilum]|uniref:RRM domain-containing protein n=1 Tax=Phialemonium thermophilum TaxID=223376 RepID=A0ABR3XEE5_9PEZI
MSSRSRSWDRRHSRRSPTPASDYSRSPTPPRRARSPSPRVPRRYSRSPSQQRNGRSGGDSRNWSRSRSATRSRSRSRSRTRSWSRDRLSRPRSRTPSLSPPLRSTKIVVERLTKNVNEDHLYEIFGQYGEIKDLDLPVNRQTGINRGTAYILYMREADAEAAIAHMHEGQIDGASINVSIVLPRRKFSPSPPMARRGANFDPRQPPPGYRGGTGAAGGRGRRSPPVFPAVSAGRHGTRPDVYRPRSESRSRSRSPPAGPGSRRYRSRSASYSSRSRSRTPPGRGWGGWDGGRRHEDYNERRRSISRGANESYDRRGRSSSRSRDWSRR